MAVAAILDAEQFSSFDLDDTDGHVIPHFMVYRGRGVHFRSHILSTRSMSRSL